jgi:hypothetical protein
MQALVMLSGNGTDLTEFLYEASPDEVNEDTGVPVFSDMTSDEIAQEVTDRAKEQARCLYPEHTVVAVELRGMMSTETEYEKAYRTGWRAASAAIVEALKSAEGDALERVKGDTYSRHDAAQHVVEDVYKTLCDRYGIGGNVEADIRRAVADAIEEED